jgi:phosphinothricin acetyltransferase
MTAPAERPPRIRLARPGDAGPILRIYAPIVRETAISFELRPPTEAEMRRRIETTLARLPWLVADVDEELAGYAYACPHREREAYQWSVEVSAYVAEAHQGRGIGAVLYRCLLTVLEAQGYRNAYGGIAMRNPGSVAFHQALGFKRIGTYRRVGYKLDRWRDVAWYGRPLGDDKAPPDGPPTPLGLMRPAVEALIARGVAGS